jgi:hypothetical protein
MVYFKHKYLTQPTLTANDRVLNAILELASAIKRKASRTAEQFNVLKTLTAIFQPGTELPILLTGDKPPPRVELDEPPPRVKLEEPTPHVQIEAPTQMQQIVESAPRVQIIEPSIPQRTTKAPEEPRLIVESEPSSIAARLLARRQQHKAKTPDHQSIAARVLARRKETANSVLDYETGQLLEYRQLLKHPKYAKAWNLSAANEFGRLAQGVAGRVKGTNTIHFIRKEEIPPDRLRDVTYIKFVCTVRTEKSEPNRTRATVGGNLINYPDDVGTPTASLLLVKILLNSVISTEGARFATADLSNFYLMTPLKRPEFLRVKLSDIPEEIIREYNLREIATPDGWVYMRVIRGMYGLPQAGSNSHDELQERLNKEGYFQSLIVPGLWRHRTRPTLFALVVDDFAIKYMSDDDLDHLIKTLRKYYDVTVDYEGKEYLKIELDWDYENRCVHLSMAPYLKKALAQFGVEKPKKLVNSPYPCIPPKYGAKQQFAIQDASPDASKEDQTRVQQVTGKFNYYARAVDPTMLPSLSAIAAQQSKPTTATVQRTNQFLDYAASQEPAVLTYRKSGMVYAFHSDAGYLNESNARSRAGGHHFLSENVENPPNNGAIHTLAEIIKAVMSSAAEAEIGSLYLNSRKGVEIRNILEEMGHKQPPTPAQVDNSTADGIVNSRVQPKQTKAMDMRFHWLRDRAVAQQQFRFYWRPGTANRGDYYTKHHPPSHHVEIRPEILTSYQRLMELRARKQRGLQGCVKMAGKAGEGQTK